jgi:hypothetical protein
MLAKWIPYSMSRITERLYYYTCVQGINYLSCRYEYDNKPHYGNETVFALLTHISCIFNDFMRFLMHNFNVPFYQVMKSKGAKIYM